MNNDIQTAVEEVYVRAIKKALDDLHKYSVLLKTADVHQYKNTGFYFTTLKRNRLNMVECWLFLMDGMLQEYFNFEAYELVTKYFKSEGWDIDEEIESSYTEARIKLRE